MLIQIAKNLIKQLPGFRSLIEERDALLSRNRRLTEDLAIWQKGFVPPGHYYSPVVDIDSVKPKENVVFGGGGDAPAGIDMREASQYDLLKIFCDMYTEMPFPEEASKGMRYYLNNDYYAYSDGICLYAMLRHLRPGKLIEIGSGYSSAASLDINDLFLNGDMKFTFIEPYPERLNALLSGGDKSSGHVEVIERFVQDVPLSTFEALEQNDILFIDSTHVSKTGSDVNYLFFDVLPSLKSGVYVHVHDIFYPFEYPASWVYEGRSWNEVYILRAFLQYNSAYEVVYFNSYIEQIYRGLIGSRMPLCLKRPDSPITIPGSIWMRKK